MEKTFNLWYKASPHYECKIKLPEEDVYLITDSETGEWNGEGNFCGWYSNEYLTDVDIYGYTNENKNKINWFKEPIKLSKVAIYSIAWGGNEEKLTKNDIYKRR